MSKFKKILYSVVASFVALVLFGNPVFAGPTSPGSGSPTTPGALCLDDTDTWVLCESTFSFGDTSAPIADGNFTALTVGTLTVTGITMAGNIDMDGYNMLSDTDGDFGIFGDRHGSVANDEFAIGKTGALDFIFGANSLQVLAGSAIDSAGVLNWSAGTAVTAGNYQITRDTDATNQLHFNVPTGAGYEWSVNDVAMATLSSVGNFNAGAGTALLPAYSFIGDPNTGIYNGTANSINFTTDGVARAGINATAFYSNRYQVYDALTPLVISGGVADGATAIGNKIGNTASLITAGAKIVSFYSDNITTEVAYINYLGSFNSGAGTVSLPAYSFKSDPDSGMYSGGADTLRLTVAGSDRLTFTNTVAQFIIQVNLASNVGIYASSALGSRFVWATGQTNDAAMITTTPTSSNTLMIAEDGDINFDFAHTIQTNPTLFIHSANQSTTQWVGLTHNQTNAEYSVGVGGHSFTQAVNTGGSPTLMTVTGAAHTGLTASTENISVDYDLDATKQWATGALTTQREFVVRAPTYGFVAASTITSAATLAVTGAPIAGTNATLTNTYSIWSQGGVNRFDGGIIGGTQTALGTGYMLDLKNSSSANVTMATTNSNSAGFAQMALFNNSGDSSVIDVFGSTYVTAAFQRNTLLGAGRSLYITSNSSGGLSTATINLYTGGNPATPEFTMAGPTGNATFSALASTSGSPAVFTITAPAHTTLAKNTEAVDVNINLARTVQFATVDTAFITQRAMLVQAPTYGFVGASTITVASTFSVTGGPLAGTNATISTGIGINSDSWGGTNATDVAALFSIPSIATSIGNVTERSALKITNGPSNILGDQTANLTNLYSVNITATTFTSTTNTRTVTGNVAGLYIAGPHVASTNVTFANTPYSIFVDAGTTRLDGNLIASGTIVQDATTTTTGAGAVAITGTIHEITTNGIGNALTLADGTEGQLLRIVYVAEGGGTDTAILTPSNLAGSATIITFNAIGDAVTLLFTAGTWFVVGANGAVTT